MSCLGSLGINFVDVNGQILNKKQRIKASGHTDAGSLIPLSVFSAQY